MKPRQKALLGRILESLATAAEPPTAIELARLLGIPHQAIPQILQLPEAKAELLVWNGRIFGRSRLASVADQLRIASADSILTPRLFRESLALSRAVADRTADALVEAGFLSRGPNGWRLNDRAEG